MDGIDQLRSLLDLARSIDQRTEGINLAIAGLAVVLEGICKHQERLDKLLQLIESRTAAIRLEVYNNARQNKS